MGFTNMPALFNDPASTNAPGQRKPVPPRSIYRRRNQLPGAGGNADSGFPPVKMPPMNQDGGATQQPPPMLPPTKIGLPQGAPRIPGGGFAGGAMPGGNMMPPPMLGGPMQGGMAGGNMEAPALDEEAVRRSRLAGQKAGLNMVR